MTHKSRNLRVRMPEVVEELESLARQKKEDCSSGYHGNEKTSMDEKPSPSEVENLLRKAADLCEKTGDPRTNPHLLGRLTAVLHQIDPEDDPHESTRRLRAYILILERYIQELKRQKNAQESSRLAFNRRHITTVYSLHNELDRLVYELRTNDLDTSTAWRKALRKWQHDQLKLAEENLRDTMVWLREGPTLSHEDTDKLTCMLFELKNNHIIYRPIPSGIIRGACTAILSVLPDKMPKWFLPWYEIDASSSYISRGGFAKVYRGRWMGSEVVYKKLKPSVSDDPSAFMKEVGLWVMFDHPHVIKLFGACHLRKRVFVSEWAEHGRLDVYVQKHGHVWQKLYEAALGLQYLHARGVIHCDLKCDNILVDRDHMAKVADFGLSWFSSVTGKDQQQTYGNPRWAAPEVLQGEPPSKESDIYSFGMCIVEAVSGEMPYENVDNNLIVKHNVIAKGFHHSYDGQLFSEAQWDLVLQCCHQEPSKRTTMDYILKSLWQFADEAHEQTSRSVVDDEKEEIELLGGQLEKLSSSKSSLHVSSHQKWSVASDRSVDRLC